MALKKFEVKMTSVKCLATLVKISMSVKNNKGFVAIMVDVSIW